MRRYLRRHKFISWLISVAVTFFVFSTVYNFLGPPHWVFVILYSVALPTGVFFAAHARRNG